MSGFGGAVKLTGESEYRSALKKITQNLKEVSSEMKLVSSSYDKNDKSVQALTAKQNALTQKLDQQKSKLSMIKTAYADMSSQYDQNKSKHQALVAEYDKEKSKLEQIGNELGTDSKEYQEQAKVVDQLSREVSESTKAQDANEKALSNMRIEMNKSQADINKTEREMDKLDKELVEAKKAEEDTAKGADKMDKSLKNTKGSTASADKGFTVLKGTLANLASDAIQKVVSGLKNLGSTAIEAWKEFDQGTDIIIAKTGASGAAAEELEDIYKNVASRVVASNEEIGTAVGEVSTRFGVTGKQLDGMSTKFLKFAKLNGTDVNQSIDNTQKALSAFGLGAEDAGNVLDMFNKVGQDTGVSMDTLMSGLIQNGTAFQEMGLGIGDSIALMGQFEKSGANGETVMQGLRKALKNATKDGVPLNDALIDLEDSIVNNADETEGLNKAYEVFGKSGDQIYGALKNGTISFRDIAQASGDFKGSVDKTFENTQDAPEKFQLAIQDIKTKMADFVDNLMEKYAPQIEKALDGVGKAIEWLTENGDEVVGVLTAMAAGVGAYVAYTTALKVMQGGWMALAVVQKIVTAGQWALNTAMSANPIGLIVAGIVALVAGFVLLWKKSEKFRNFWKGLWKSIKKFAEPVIKAIVTAFTKAWDLIKKAWEVAINFFKGVWNGIKTVFSAVASFFSNAFKNAWNAIKSAWSAVASFFSGIWNGIKKVFADVVSFFKNLFTNAWNAIKGAWSAVASFFSGIWSSIEKAFANVVSFFKGIFSDAWAKVKYPFTYAYSFFSDRWADIKGVFANVVKFFKDTFSDAWGKVKHPFTFAYSFFSDRWADIKGVFANVVKFFKDTFSDAWAKVKYPFTFTYKFFSDRWADITGIFKDVKTWFSDKFGSAWKEIKKKFAGWGKFWSDLWEGIKTKFKNLGTSIGGAISKTVKSGINGVISGAETVINKGIGLINGAINLINKIPGVNVGKVGKVKFGRLAKGGVLKKGQIGVLEGSGAEAVVPLEKNTQWISRVADAMRTELAFSRRQERSPAVEQLRYDDVVSAFKTALSDMEIVLDDQTAGKFVEKTVTRLIYA